MGYECNTIIVLGGHRLSCSYVKKLIQAKKKNIIDFKKLYVIDPDESCLARTQFKTQIEWIPKEYHESIADLMAHENLPLENSLLIPDHTAPHVLLKVFIKLIENVGIKMGQPLHPQLIHFEKNLNLPFQKKLDSGICAVSHATWTCPVDCDEPNICPAIQKKRDWDLKNDFESLVAPIRGPFGASRWSLVTTLHLFFCDQLVDGVVFIPFKKIKEEWERLALNIQKDITQKPTSFLVATYSKCHGIVGYAKVNFCTPEDARHR